MRIFMVMVCLVVCLSLSSCVYVSSNLIRAQGTELDISINPLLGMYNFKGKDVAVTVFRQSGTNKRNKDGSTEKPIALPDIKEGPSFWSLDNAPQSKTE